MIDVQVKEKKKEETWYWYAAASALLDSRYYLFLVRKEKPCCQDPGLSILTKRQGRNWKTGKGKFDLKTILYKTG